MRIYMYIYVYIYMYIYETPTYLSSFFQKFSGKYDFPDTATVNSSWFKIRSTC